MENEIPSFATEVDGDENAAAATLFHHPRASDFADGLERDGLGWRVIFTHNRQPVVLTAMSLSALATAFVEWTPQRELQRQELQRRKMDAAVQAEADRQAADRRANENKSLLRRTLSGGGA